MVGGRTLSAAPPRFVSPSSSSSTIGARRSLVPQLAAGKARLERGGRGALALEVAPAAAVAARATRAIVHAIVGAVAVVVVARGAHEAAGGSGGRGRGVVRAHGHARGRRQRCISCWRRRGERRWRGGGLGPKRGRVGAEAGRGGWLAARRLPHPRPLGQRRRALPQDGVDGVLAVRVARAGRRRQRRRRGRPRRRPPCGWSLVGGHRRAAASAAARARVRRQRCCRRSATLATPRRRPFAMLALRGAAHAPAARPHALAPTAAPRTARAARPVAAASFFKNFKLRGNAEDAGG